MSERERIAELERMCNRLAASVVLLTFDAHPTYANTTGWRGGIGGSALTRGCSVVDPPPGVDWAQLDMPSGVASEWARDPACGDLAAIGRDLIGEWTAMLAPELTP